jgi:diguanylate cyclase (GGDEF)-like protein
VKPDQNQRLMDAQTGALAMAAGGLAVAAGALARAGARQRSFRGWRWWVAAMLVGAFGLLAAPWAADLPATAAAVQAVLTVWAPLTLVGLRRFHARLGLPGLERIDWAVLALGAATAPWLPGAAVLVVHLYVAALMWSTRTAEDAGPLRLVGAVVAAVALPPSLAPWDLGRAPVIEQAVGSGLALLVIAFVMLSLMHERTERELRESRRRLRVLANTDPLTSTPNRRHFHELATRLLRRADAERPVLLVFDIDHFKLINDKLGHPAGDRALRLVGRCMQDALRANDLAGRLGGDEFALLLGGASLQQAIGVAERIVQQLQSQSAEHHLPVLTLSFGLVQVLSTENVDDALRRADQALYEAKRQGRSRAVAAHGDEDEPVFSESQRLGLTPL